MVGQTIGHYLVLEKLGSGGMGDIYKAQDARLNRYVAIKALTKSSAVDPDRRRRFTQEAQAASALNHPNIITIHDILSENETEYMVMEFVGGRNLADRIPNQGLGVAKTLQYGLQIADALRAAHAAGIIHRDLKPGNVMVTDTGLVKVLDFGLAKLSTPALSEETQTLNAAPMTIEGSILGTVSYMSPEQAQGRRVDARSDIFSLGVLLYEMVTGQKAFSADSTISTIACILRDEVKPISDLANGVPAELEEVIGRALRKDPSDRWQTMDELFLVLAALKQKFDSGILTHTQILAHPVSVENQAAQKNRMLVTMVAAIAAAVAVSGGGGWWWAARKSARLEAAKQKAAAAAAAAAVVPAPAGALPATPAEPPAPVTPTAPASTALTNDDVLSMVKEKLSASLIIGQIRASETKFDLSTPEVIRLAKEGVPERVIEAMRNPKAVPPERSASASARNPAPQAPVVPPAQLPSAAPVTLPPPVAPPVSVVAPPPVAAPPAPVSSGGTVVATRPVSALVLGGLPIAITLMANVPAGAEPGTALRFQVAQDLRVNGTIVVAQGAQVAGEVLGAGKKVLGIGGKMQFKLISVGAVDGKRLRIRASPGRNTEKNEHSIEAPGNRNKELLAPVGTQYMAYVDGDQIVAVKK